MALGISRFIGGKWIILGVGMMLVGIFALIAHLIGLNLPSIDNPILNILATVLLTGLGVFCISWGNALLSGKEWGAFAGGIIRLTLMLYLLVGIFFWGNSVINWMQNISLDFYQRFMPIVVILYLLLLFWLMITTYLLLASRTRWGQFAEAYQEHPLTVSDKQLCAKHGLWEQANGCPACQPLEVVAQLKIRERIETLKFDNSQDIFIVGRKQNSGGADIVLSEPEVAHPNRISRQHLQIQYHFDYQQFTLQDLASQNKTYLNDDSEPLQAHTPIRLHDGDRINVAQEITLIFLRDDEPAADIER